MAKNKKRKKGNRNHSQQFNPFLTKSTNSKYDRIAKEKGLVRGTKEYNDYIWGEVAKIEKQLGPEGFAKFNQFVMMNMLSGVKL